ncbi:MAG TPA: amino acid permease [Candidatus Dormibacteraeota bacterium]|nr:amino acid permease [Candidatus Dormibacteraeota bacterium]
MPEQASLTDEQVLQSFGYQQELRRALRLFSLYAVAFSIISITTGIFTNFGFGLAHLGPASIWLWILAGVGQLLVALVISELGTRMPLAGYSYQWGSRLVNSVYGWFVGFTALCYLSVGGAGITFVVVAPRWATILGLDPTNQTSNLVITLVLLALPLGINIISVALAARINNVAVFTEIIGTVVVALILIILFATRPMHPVSFLFDTGGVTGSDILAQLPFAALMGIFTIVGFELAADLSEEAFNARVTVPKAVIWSVVSSAVLGIVALIGFALAIPDLKKIAASPVPLADIFTYWLGSGLTKVFLLFVVFSIFSLSVVGTAATGRLIFSLARDNMLPVSSLLRRVDPRTRTPIPALLVATSLSLIFTIYGYLNDVYFGGNAFTVLITATATPPYLVYLGTLLAYVWKRNQLMSLPGAFRLGGWARPVMIAALAWVLLVLVLLTIPKDFWGADVVCVIVEVVALAWWLLVLRGRLQRGEAGVRQVAAPATGITPAAAGE